MAASVAARACCTRVLEMHREDENVKALYRRGVARLELRLFEEAIADLRAACVADPKSKELREAFLKAKAAQTAFKAAERAKFANMFEVS